MGILIRREDLQRFKLQHIGLGWVDKYAEGIHYISLPTLRELKIACGMTTSHRPRDLDDVIQLIRANQLALEYADQLNPYVQDKYRELWQAAQVSEEY